MFRISPLDQTPVSDTWRRCVWRPFNLPVATLTVINTDTHKTSGYLRPSNPITTWNYRPQDNFGSPGHAKYVKFVSSPPSVLKKMTAFVSWAGLKGPKGGSGVTNGQRSVYLSPHTTRRGDKVNSTALSFHYASTRHCVFLFRRINI